MGIYRHLVRADSIAPDPIVAAVNLCSGGFFGIGTFVPHGFVIGSKVKFTGFVKQPEINGVHTVTSVTGAQSFKIDVACSGVDGENGFVELYDESTFTEVYPLGFSEADFDWKRAPDKVYYKRTFTGTLFFTNRPIDGITDYDYFVYIETNDSCGKVQYILQKYCNNDWQDEWTAYFSVTDGEWDKDKCKFSVKPIPDDNLDCMEEKVDLNILDTDEVTTYYKAGTIAARNYENTRLLSVVLDFLATGTCSRISGVISDFYQINPENESDINYVTGEVNPYKSITIGMKQDIFDPIPADLQTQGITSFTEIMTALNTLHNVFYTVVNGFVRIEHISYFESQAGLDLTLSKYDRWTKNTNKYTYEKTSLPNLEVFNYTDIGSVGQIIYGTYCNNNVQQVKSYSTGNYSVNLIGLRQRQYEIKSQDGFVLMCTTYNSGTGKYDVIGPINDELLPYKLILKFFRHNRSQLDAVFHYGTDNFGDLFIYSTKKSKLQKEFAIPLCCDDDFSVEDYMTTALGKGYLGGAKFNIKSDILKLNLLYGAENLPDIEPDDLSGLQFWVKGDDANAAGAISSWTDQSGNGRHATQATGSKQPIKVAGVQNGLPVIRFDGSNDGLATSAFQTFPSKRGTVFIVWKNYQPINANDDHLVGTYGSGSGNMWDIATQYFQTVDTLNSKIIHSFANAGDLLAVDIASEEYAPSITYNLAQYGYTNFILGCLRRDADATIHFSTNGLGENTIAIANTQQTSNPLNIGNSFIAGNSNPLKGDIAEIIIYDRAISLIEKQRIERYLIKKWALFPYS